VFRADLDKALRGRRIDAVMCRSASAFLFARGNEQDRSWQLGTYLRHGWADETPAVLNELLIGVIRTATGLPELQPAIEDTARWRTGAYVAERFRVGPAFLVGDAAHLMPPYGGFGGNTGVQDAHDLAWRMGLVLRGHAPESLLDGYEIERRPIAELTVAQALLRSRKTPGQAPSPGEVDATNLALGFRYPQGAGTGALHEDPTHPTASPGTRAPHVSLTDGRSTLDLVEPAGLTIIGSAPLSISTGYTAPVLHLAPIDPENVAAAHKSRWDATYGAPGVAGLLVRPDGVIAAPISHDDVILFERIIATVLRGA
jgi:hypothetical protein